MADNIPGTNIPKSSITADNKHTWQEWASILAASDDKNDVLFDMAYWNEPGGQGQGNPDVGAVQSNIWSLTGDHETWAEEAVKSASGTSDIYYDRSDPGNVTTVAGADYGQAGSADDLSRSNLYFTGTNMPTTGFTTAQINDFNSRLSAEIANKNWKGANDVMFDIAWAMGKNFYGSPTDAQGGYGQGNKFVGMLQSDMFSLTDPAASMWGEDYINSENDVYTLRDLSGNPRGGLIRYNDDTGSYIDTGSGLLGNVPFQDWSRFMPTETPYYQLGEFAGAHYQPWATGLPVGGGSGPILTPPGGGGGTTTGPGVINPNIWGTDTTTTNTNTGVIPGSDKANDLAAGRIHHTEMYDANDMWVGAEGPDVAQNFDFSSGPGSRLGDSFMNMLANNPVTRITNLLNAQLGFVNGIDTGYGPEGVNGQGESERDIDADIEATRDGGLVA